MNSKFKVGDIVITKFRHKTIHTTRYIIVRVSSDVNRLDHYLIQLDLFLKNSGYRYASEDTIQLYTDSMREDHE